VPPKNRAPIAVLPTPVAAVRFHDLISGRQRGFAAAVARGGLAAASLGYAAGLSLRNRLFDSGWQRQSRAPVAVVSVGNLTLGGTGKTPCVEYLAGFYRERGRRVAILSRGYGGRSGAPNDEALVLKENLPDVPHLQAADRVTLARRAAEDHGADLLILDDGFQHRRLARDLDVVLIDATEPFRRGWLFPRGLLREPPSSLRRAHAVLLTRCDQAEADAVSRLVEAVRDLVPERPVVQSEHGPVAWIGHGRPEQPVDALRGRPVAAFCGIGNPKAFRRTLCAVAAEPVAFRVFPDHHIYTSTDVDDLRRWAGRLPDGAVVVTTQKDLVKLRPDSMAGRDLLALRVALQVRAGPDADLFHRRLAEVG
jgi:tetraacyldisaccharide 4'-kinase